MAVIPIVATSILLNNWKILAVDYCTIAADRYLLEKAASQMKQTGRIIDCSMILLSGFQSMR
jgi:hypothetical protein